MVNIKYIADVARVSKSTVSKALNGYSDVSEKTRQRIFEIAKELGYIPNATAQSLARKSAKTIGIVYEVESGLRNLFFSSILESFRRHVEAKGYDILILSNNSDSGLDYLKHCLSKNVDAVLVFSGDSNQPSIKKLYDSDLAVITIDPYIQSNNSVYSNSYQAIHDSCEYLYQLGHRKIAFIHGNHENFIGEERLKSYLDFMASKNLKPMIHMDQVNKLYSFDEGYQTMKAIHHHHGVPDAVCCVSDLMAIGVIAYLQKRGIKIPNDVSVIGFDDLQLCDIVTPRLTTVRQDYEQFGALASKTLIDMIGGSNRTHEPIILSTQLVVRDSCKKRS